MMDARGKLTRETGRAKRSLSHAADASARRIGRYTVRVRPTFVRLSRPASQSASSA